MRNEQQAPNEGRDESTEYILENWSVTYGTEQELAEKLRLGELLVVSDGSFFPESRRAAFQVRMETEDGMHKAQLQQHLIGKDEDMDAYRAEATGIWATIAVIRRLSEKYGIREAEIKYGCDRKAALGKVSLKNGR